MTNEDADAIRAEVGRRLVERHGDLKAAAKATKTPYKSMYRAFTEDGKDRTKTVTLDFIMQMIAHLHELDAKDNATSIIDAALPPQ